MTTRLNPYLSFRDTTRQAMEFYRSVFGGELAMNTFAEFHASQDPAEQHKIMHAMLTTPNGFVLMAADTPNSMELKPGNGSAISLSGDDGAALGGWWDKLSAGGTVTMPLAKQIWGDMFGMCTDKFGVSWMVNIAGSGP
jgi:PhnB protein